MLKKVLLLVILLAVPFVLLRSVFAQKLTPGNNVVTLPKYSTVDKDYFATGGTVNLSGNVNGDAYLAGGNITVDGNIYGDLIAAGGNITVSGNTAGNVRVLGGNITISGKVGKNLTVAGGSVNIANAAQIAGSLVSGSGDLTVSAPIGKGATLDGGDASILSTIGGEVLANTSKIMLGAQSVIGGNLTYSKDTAVDLQRGAQVKGKMIVNSPVIPPASAFKGTVDSFIQKVGMGLKFIDLASALLIALLLVKFAPNYLDKTVKILTKRPLRSFGVGLLVVFGIPLVSIILILTVIGIPIALILLGVLIIAIYLSKIFISLLVGQKVLEAFKTKAGRGLAVAVGLVIYSIVAQIPLLGSAVVFFSLVAGLGAQAVERLALYKQVRSKKLI